MTRKISFGITAILIIISIVSSSVITLLFVLKTYDDLLVDLPQRAEQYIRLGEIDEIIRNEYIGVADDVAIDDSLASGYISGLNDPYSMYISDDDITTFRNNLSGKNEGTGINAYYEKAGNHLIVSFVQAGSPAEKSGILVNDIIVSVNGESVSEQNYQFLLDSITTSFDNKVKIAVQRNGKDEVTQESFEISTGYELSSCIFSVENGIGYIRLNAFYENTFSLFCVALEHFGKEKITDVILDLRNSSGQNYNVAAKIIDYIVPVGTEGSGVIFTAKNSSGDIVDRFSSDSNAVNMKFAVLINTRTEAAAELVASDLKDFGKGILIGEVSAGYGTMQKLFELSSGGAIYLSVAEVFPYISDTFNNKGIKPDIIIETSEAFKNQLGGNDFSADEQYKTAVSYFTGKK